MLYLLSYTGMVGMLGLEPRNPKERIYSPPQLPLCHIPIPFSSDRVGTFPLAAESILQGLGNLVNVFHPSGRLYTFFSVYLRVCY